MKAIRGAITVDNNTEEDILSSTSELLKNIVEENGVKHDDIVSITFSCTKDITKVYPAVAARKMGYTDVALFCLQEMEVENSLPMCIRVLIYVNGVEKPRHVYLKSAKQLRRDI